VIYKILYIYFLHLLVWTIKTNNYFYILILFGGN